MQSLWGFLILPSILVVTMAASGKASEDSTVNRAVEAIALCYHWAGEGGEGDEERTRQIVEGLNRDCPVAEKLARKAYTQYPHNAELAYYIFNLIEIEAYSSTESERQQLCAAALPYYKTLGYEDPTYLRLCP